MTTINIRVTCAQCQEPYEIASMGAIESDGDIVVPVVPGHECKASEVDRSGDDEGGCGFCTDGKLYFPSGTVKCPDCGGKG
jgi:hypothetical protein